MSNYNEIDPLSDIVLLNHNDIIDTIDGTSKGINPIPSFGIAKGISAEVSAVKQEYFKLSANNLVSGDNIFTGKQIIDGSLSVKNLYAKDSDSIFIGEDSLCSILSNEITLSTSTAYSDLSNKLSTNFNFIYDNDNNELCVTVAGNTKVVSAAKFTEARLLDSVQITYVSGKPVLEMKFKTDVVGSFTIVSVDLDTLMPLYAGNDGIDIQYQDGKYQVSADNTICRRQDISSIQVTNSITEGYILTSLTQDKGKISYVQKQLSTNHVAGLENYVQTLIDNSEKDLRAFTSTLSGDAGVISSLCSTVDATIQSLDFDNPGFYEANKIKVLTSISETDGKISASTKILDYHEIDGLSTAIDSKFDKTGGAIDGSLSVRQSILVNGATSTVSDPTNGGIAIGRNSILNNEESFVWSGAHDAPLTYSDHGQHTFNINPLNGISGFYIGDKNLRDTIIEIGNTKISALYSTILSALDRGGIEGKEYSEISFGNALSCIYFLGQALKDIKDIIEK